MNICMFFFFNDTATTEIYTLSLHDALPILTLPSGRSTSARSLVRGPPLVPRMDLLKGIARKGRASMRSEEHTSELQSRQYLVCRLLLEKKKKHNLIISLILLLSLDPRSQLY